MNAPQSELTELAAFANALADRATEITLRYFRHQIAIEQKDDESPVTIADRETEQALREMIIERYPDHGLVGEEFGRQAEDASHVWVIDPIDGTRSFITGMPLFGTLIALLRDGEPVLGIIETAAMRDRWLGVSGMQTRWNGEPCRTNGRQALEQATLFATTVDMFVGNERDTFERLSARTASRRFGGDCYAYGLLASGFVDLVVEASLEPYDFMALAPVVTGAGGVFTNWDGQTVSLESGPRVVAAASPALHEQALETLSQTPQTP